jgi:hypothetical protein
MHGRESALLRRFSFASPRLAHKLGKLLDASTAAAPMAVKDPFILID